MSDSIRISQCMIVKNEEYNMKAALEWGKKVCFEQIVVDTGSTDQTVSIAEAMGAKVYHFDWINDFSAAKNYGISLCQGEWIAFLDADEYFSEGEAAKLQKVLEECDERGYKAVRTAMHNIEEDGTLIGIADHVRLFRNHCGIHYKRSIHEFLTHDSLQIATYDARKELVITHTGYAARILASKKASGRNAEMIRRELDANPNDYELWGYLGDDYNTRDELEKSFECYQKAIELMPDDAPYENVRCAWTLLYFLQLMQKLKKPMQDILDVHFLVTKYLPDNPDVDYYLAKYFYEQCDYIDAEQFYQSVFRKLNTDKGSQEGTFTIAHLTEAAEETARCYRKLGKYPEAMEYALFGLQCDKMMYRCLREFMKSAMTLGDTELVETTASKLDPIYDWRERRDKMVLYKCACEVDNQILKEWAIKKFTEEELTALKSSGLL